MCSHVMHGSMESWCQEQNPSQQELDEGAPPSLALNGEWRSASLLVSPDELESGWTNQFRSYLAGKWRPALPKPSHLPPWRCPGYAAFPRTGRAASVQKTEEKAFHGGTPCARGNIFLALLGRKKVILEPCWFQAGMALKNGCRRKPLWKVSVAKI